jgi:hypothetical protein
MNRLQRNGGFPFYYWFLIGLVTGLLAGWFFSGFINAILRLALFAGVIAVIGVIVYLWRKSSRSVGVTANQTDIPEGSWRNIDPSGRE